MFVALRTHLDASAARSGKSSGHELPSFRGESMQAFVVRIRVVSMRTSLEKPTAPPRVYCGANGTP